MTRTTITAAFALLLSLTTATAGNVRKGVGCWRTVPRHHQAATRMLKQWKSEETSTNIFTGTKRGLVILAEFQDVKFKSTNDQEKYLKIMNEPGYTTPEGFMGSVSDYFRDQSGGLFDLQFDVVGPYTASKTASYYGKNDKDGNDEYAHLLIVEMCKAADADVNFVDYDWDGDGEAEEVFVVYAGKGEADTDGASYIYPHMWTLTEAGVGPLKFDGTLVDIYACANELTYRGAINGIGTFCHEFSHCMGFPDFYDITYSGLFGMGDFDLMSGGNYAGNGFRPVGYTAYEKMMCGWTIPIVLGDEDVTVDSMAPISRQGDTYIIYNEAYPDEYYLIENRQKTGWDADYPAKGLLITHVDYDEEVWYNNIPNSILTRQEALDWGLTAGNDHQRMTLFHADNDDDTKYWNEYGGYHTKSTVSTDLYPYRQNDSLTATSKPAATLFHRNTEGIKKMRGAITHIKQNSDKTMSFTYRAPVNVPVAIRETPATTLPRRIYTLDGRVAGTTLESLPHGIYVIDGRKVVR